MWDFGYVFLWIGDNIGFFEKLFRYDLFLYELLGFLGIDMFFMFICFNIIYI